MNHFYTGRPSYSVFTAGSFNDAVRKVIVDSNYAYVFGDFTTYRGADAKYMAKISLATGNLDSSFNTSTGCNGPVLDAVLDGGYLYIVGGFESYKGTTRNGIAKVSATDASLDSTFNSATAFNRGASELADGMVISGSYLYVIGSFFTYKGTNRSGLVQINKSDASLGAYFSGPDMNMSASGLAVDASYLYLVGDFDTFSGTTLSGLAKIELSTGNLVTGGYFGTSNFTEVPTKYPYSIVCEGSYLYVGGNFTTYNNTTRNGIVKLRNDGFLDSTFDPSTGFNSAPLVLASDGSSLYAGGAFTAYNGTTTTRVTKLSLSDASLDSSFSTTTGANSTVRTIALDGSSVYLGGSFTAYKGATRNYLTRISTSDATNNSY